MAGKAKVGASLKVKAYRGDAKTLLAFNLPQAQTAKLAGFTIECQPPGKPAYYLYNELQFEHPAQHAQVATEPPYSSVNAPIHYFRWVHVLGSNHQGLKPVWGKYTYTVTPRYFDANASMMPLDGNLSKSVEVEVGPFKKGKVSFGFTRGYTQSQAFVRHFGKDALIRPKEHVLMYPLTDVAGSNAKGEQHTFEQEYEWLGYTARELILGILDEVLTDSKLKLDVFAYDLNEVSVVTKLLELAKQGRVRVILDNASLHKDGFTKTGEPKPAFEDEFEKKFNVAKKGNSALQRGHFASFSHDKVFIVSGAEGPKKVLTGSTNFYDTGLYVNSNHVLVFDDVKVAKKYREVFEAAWKDKVKAAPFRKSELSDPKGFSFKVGADYQIMFSPHTATDADKVLGGVVARIKKEASLGKDGNVMFAVMGIHSQGKKPNVVYSTLSKLHEKQKFFSYGVSDTTSGISLYKPHVNHGIVVTGKPTETQLPEPFDQVPGVAGHQIHHKFVVCGFNRADATLYCGSSNLAEGGETKNGDNLIEIQDKDIATVFAIEAVALVDHFNFLDNYQNEKKKATKEKSKSKEPITSKREAAKDAHWYLSTSDGWTAKYYDPEDLKCVDRELFA